MSNMITTREALNQELGSLFARVDMAAIGTIKPHMKAPDGSDTKVETGEFFATAQVRLPGVQEVTYEGEKFFSDHVAIKIDAFKLKTDATVRAASSKPKAATVSASALRERLSGGKVAPEADASV